MSRTSKDRVSEARKHRTDVQVGKSRGECEMSEWEEECLRWRGRILTGECAHFCFDWDDLPIDETCEEWPCACEKDIRAQQAAGTWGKE